jgi:hypothetical protein
MGRLLVALACCATLAAGCGDAATPLAPACTEGEEAILHALASAPGPVALADGTRLSRCIADGEDDAEMQNVGLVFHRAAEQLRGPAAHDRRAALELGYLVGATRRGAAHSNGVMAELVRRIELVAGSAGDGAPPAVADALRRGLAAGERGG